MSGSVVCESCGGTCFYENTIEEIEAYMAAWDAWNKKQTQKETDDADGDDPVMRAEMAKIRKINRETRTGFYGSTSTKSPVTLLRKMTAKVRKH